MLIFFVLATLVVVGCSGIGIYEDEVHYGPQLPIPTPFEKFPSERSYQCTCTNGVTTKTIPFHENDPNFSFISNYFTQPFRNVVSTVQSFFRNPQAPELYGTAHVPNFGDKYYHQPGDINNQKSFAVQFPQHLDCLKNINYATSPCLAALVNHLQSSRYQLFPGVPYSMYNQPESFQPGVKIFGSFPGSLSANLNTPQQNLRVQAGGLSFPNGNLNANVNTNGGIGFSKPGNLNGNINANLNGNGFPNTNVNANLNGFGAGIGFSGLGGLNANLNTNLNGGIGFQRPGNLNTNLNTNLNGGIGFARAGNLNANLNGGIGFSRSGNLNANLNTNLIGGIGIARPGNLNANLNTNLNGGIGLGTPGLVVRNNLPQVDAGVEVRSNLPAEGTTEGAASNPTTGQIQVSTGTDQPQPTTAS